MLSRRVFGVSPCFTSSVTATTGVETSFDVDGASVVAANALAAGADVLASAADILAAPADVLAAVADVLAAGTDVLAAPEMYWRRL